MPTILIASDPLPVPTRRRIAVQLTTWLRDRGVAAAHVIVRFTAQAEQSVFSGGLPVEALPDSGAEPRYASVTCCVAPDRDEKFRAGLAAELAAALRADAQTSLLHIEFRPTAQQHVYVWRTGALCRADELMPLFSGKDER